MKKYVNGEYIELTSEEIDAAQAEQRECELREKTRRRTLEEGLLELNREVLAEKLAATEDKTLAIACMALFEPWTPGAYAMGDIRTDPATGYPRECMTAHDSRTNTEWTINTASLWKPYHSRKKEYALPWEAPAGAHDIYRAGEYMIWTDGSTYHCKADTSFSPADYGADWEKVD